MRIVSMMMDNWMPYAGMQVLDLKAQAYSVVARYAGDAERSNWGGKSAFLKAPVFALYGEHTSRTEDGWITEGHDIGGVSLIVEDGVERFEVKRTRKRGKSTVLTVTPEGAAQLKGEEAQKFLSERMGLTAADFGATCYFEQRQMARMVLAKPQDRMDIVGAWLRLEPLVAAEEQVRKELSDLSLEHGRLISQLSAASQVATAELGDQSLAEKSGVVVLKEKEVEHARDAKASAEQAVREARRLAVARSRVAEYERIVEAGTKVKADLEGMNLDELRNEASRVKNLETEMAVLVGQAARDVQTKRKVSLGQFDGTCPVAGIECPATDVINKKSAAGKKALETAQSSLETLEEKHERYADEWTKAAESVAVAERLKSRLSALRDQVRALKPDYELAKENVGAEDQSERLEEQYTQACNRLMSLEGELSSMRASLNRATEARERARKLDHDVEDLQARMGVKREALVVFGKLGAQKRVAESALKSIEDGANAMLRECGIDLSVEVQWSREGGGLARSCDACGHPFGTSAKVKQCERCGADRGPLLVNKLELVLSDRSGAAEDLAGASIQLSASAWLREDRGSAWSVALVDEPYGALDASNRKAFSTHIASMLAGRYGFVQAFVVSHSPDTVTQLPGRIEILNDGGRATVRVV